MRVRGGREVGRRRRGYERGDVKIILSSVKRHW
jgi:hypothetical protein